MVEGIDRDQPTLLNRSDAHSSVVSDSRARHFSSNENTDPRQPTAAFVCRKVKPTDVRFLARNLDVSHFDQPDSFASRNGVLSQAFGSMRPFIRNRPITNIALTPEGSFQGFIQFKQLPPDRRWILTAMGVCGDCEFPTRMSTDLLEFSIKRAGSRGVKRLFARVSPQSADREALAAVGFEPYMSESLLRLGHLDAHPGSGKCVVREQEPADTWAVHQLYHGSVPRHVQFAEAWTSQQWDLNESDRFDPHWRAFVLEDGFQINAWARVRRAGKVASVEFMYLPDRVEMLQPFVYEVLTRIKRESGVGQVFATARAYQAELQSILMQVGFIEIGAQDLMIKYTTAKVMVKSTEFQPAPASDVLERVPKRVPTYLNGSAREEPT